MYFRCVILIDVVKPLELWTWSQIAGAGMAPSPRSYHTCVAVGKFLYIFGGFDGVARKNDFYCFNTGISPPRTRVDTQEWRQIITNDIPPSPRDRHTAVCHDSSMFIFGGFDGLNKLNDFYEFNTDTNTWQEIICSGHGATPSARHSHACVVYEDSMYVFGGFDGSCKNDLHRFNFTTNVWTTVSSAQSHPPKPRYLASATIYKDAMFIIGGHDESHALNDFFAFNFQNEQWMAIDFHSGLIPPPRDSHSLTTHVNSLYLFGGTTTVPSDMLYEYKVEESKWYAINSKAGDNPAVRYLILLLQPIRG